MICAVIDTNVLVSAIITHNDQSPTAKVLDYLVSGKFVPLIDKDILKEYERVLARPKFNLPYTKVQKIINLFLEQGVLTDRTDFEAPMIDETDRVFLEISLTVENSHLVTGNLKHYPHISKVVTPAEFIHFLQEYN